MRSSSTKPTTSCPPRREPRSRSALKTGCATTTTSSRIRFATSARTCRASTTSSCRSWPTGPFAGYPRVYLLARELIAHTAGRIDLETLVDFTSRLSADVAARRSARSGRSRSCCGSALVEELRRLAEASVGARAAASEARRLGTAARRSRHWDERIIDACCATRPRQGRPPGPGLRRRAAAVAARPAVDRGAGLAGAASRAGGAGRLGRRDAAAASISAKPPTSSRSATSSRACG